MKANIHINVLVNSIFKITLGKLMKSDVEKQRDGIFAIPLGLRGLKEFFWSFSRLILVFWKNIQSSNG